MDPKNYKSTKLRGQTIEELEVVLNDLRSELAALRVNQVSSGVAAKLAKIKVIFNFQKVLRLSKPNECNLSC